MKNIDDIIKLIKEEATDGFSDRADQEFCKLLDYGYEFRKEFMIKRMQQTS
ncbi:MAG: hypothetical protein HXS52_13995 [Theionarchaea archaeon]|nr:hypothetical protein [Theionarchaea archaeon]MBU7039035.1 hypothetical protein [Theionarchaea archaeon]